MTHPKSEFIHCEDRVSDHPFLEKVWRCHSERADTLLSIAANNFEMVVTRLRGKSSITLRGPETAASLVECRADPHPFQARYLHAAISSLQSAGPQGCKSSGSERSFFLAQRSALEYPDFDKMLTWISPMIARSDKSEDERGVMTK